jgi:hypothetical protein
MFLGVLLGFARPRGVAADERVEARALARAEILDRRYRDARNGAERLLRIVLLRAARFADRRRFRWASWGCAADGRRGGRRDDRRNAGSRKHRELLRHQAELLVDHLAYVRRRGRGRGSGGRNRRRRRRRLGCRDVERELRVEELRQARDARYVLHQLAKRQLDSERATQLKRDLGERERVETELEEARLRIRAVEVEAGDVFDELG